MTKLFDKIIIILLILVIAFLSFLLYNSKKEISKIPEETAIQLAQAATIIRPSFATEAEINKLLVGTPFANLGWAFLKVEQTYGIGADFMYALARQESSLGTANKWSKPPYNNPYSWDITSKGAGSEAYFDSIPDCMMYVASKLKKNYLTPNGAYYKGQTVQSVAVYYCGGDDVAWYTGILNYMKYFQSKLPEASRAKIFAMETGIIKGNLPEPKFFTSDYWQTTPTLEQLAIYFYRINGAK